MQTHAPRYRTAGQPDDRTTRQPACWLDPAFLLPGLPAFRLSGFLWFVCFFFCLVVSAVHAQTSAPAHTVDGEYIKEWLVLGPFFPGDLETNFLADVGGEANMEPQEGDTQATAEGTILTWKRYRTRGNFVDLILAATGGVDHALFGSS